MSNHEKSFAFYKGCIDDLCSKVNQILEIDGNPEQVKTLVIDVNCVYTEMERAMLQEEVPSKFVESLGSIQSQHALKAEFDAKVFDWLSSKNIPRGEIESILRGSRALRSKGSFQTMDKSSTKSSLKSSNSTSSKSSSRTSKALALAKVETARLRVKQLEEKHRIQNEETALKERLQKEETALKERLQKEETALKERIQKEETAYKQKLEMLQVSHELEEASLERQVLDEELDRAGYIAPEELNAETIFDKAPILNVSSTTAFNEDNFVMNFSTNKSVNSYLLEDKPTTSGKQICESNTKPKMTKVLPSANKPSRSNPSAESDNVFPADLQKKQTVPNNVQQTRSSQFTAENSKISDQVIQPAFYPQRSSNNDLVGALTNAFHLNQSKPTLELFKFNGDSTTYTRFISTLEATIEKLETDNRIRLLYLIQHCDGKAKSLIQYCVLLEPNVGYAKAKEILYENFGKRTLIARTYIKNLVEGRPIRQEDSNALIRFAHDIEECHTTLGHMNYFADLNCFENICKVAKRLPSGLQNRWLRKVAAIERQRNKPTFKDLMEFVKEEAQVVSSCYASAANWKSSNWRPSKIGTVPKVNTHSTIVSHNKERCPFCWEKHVLWDCPVFARKGLNVRLQFMRQKRLCDNCAKQGHISRFCYANAKCTRSNCNLKHHTLLHRSPPTVDYRIPTFKDTSSKSVGTSTESHSDTLNVSNFHGSVFKSDNVFLNVIPVRVSCGDNSVLTYAFLDQGSTATLCDKRLLDQLKASGDDVNFDITTINGNSTFRQGTKVSLTLSSLVGSETLFLPNVLSVDHVPTSPNPSLSRRDLMSWPHLQDVNLPLVKGDITVLIGVDVPEAFWVLEERRGSSGEPYAVRTKLGWSVVGPKLKHKSVSTTVNVNFVSTNQMLEKQIECLWTIDNVPSKLDLCLSKEDRYALQLMKRSKNFVAGHYEVALPWRPGSAHFPDNRNQALFRLSSLKKRLEKDLNLREKYVSTIESYISNGHAELAKPNEEKISCWYLPHHPVLHPRKPDKVRVVFDCAARTGGTSLNDQLLRGPDFLNSLVEVLIRFRLEKIAVVSDIEQMFHQVHVSPPDKNYLRFFWWPKGDLTLSPTTYHMTVHIFGATSSPSCVQFCLLETVKDSVHSISERAKQIIANNFYMDDCLFSVPSVSEAALLANEISEALKDRGFNLTKWLTNSKELLQLLPQDKLSSSIVNLSDCDQVCERVLGLKWDVFDDVFKFQVNVKNKPPTRRGMLSVLSSVFDPLGFVAPAILVPKLLLQELCRKKYDWDELMTDSDLKLWQNWLEDLTQLSQLSISRCLNISHEAYTELIHCQLHHFSDASSRAYGTVSILRCVTKEGQVFCNFVLGKARLAPLKSVSIQG